MIHLFIQIRKKEEESIYNNSPFRSSTQPCFPFPLFNREFFLRQGDSTIPSQPIRSPRVHAWEGFLHVMTYHSVLHVADLLLCNVEKGLERNTAKLVDLETLPQPKQQTIKSDISIKINKKNLPFFPWK